MYVWHGLTPKEAVLKPKCDDVWEKKKWEKKVLERGRDKELLL